LLLLLQIIGTMDYSYNIIKYLSIKSLKY